MGRLSLATWLYIAAVVSAAGAILADVPVGDFEPGFWVVCGALALLFLDLRFDAHACSATGSGPGRRVRRPRSPPLSCSATAALGAAMVGAIAVLQRPAPCAARRAPLQRRDVRDRRLCRGQNLRGPARRLRRTSSLLTGEYREAVADPARHAAPRGPHADRSFEMALVPFAAAAVVHVLVNHGLLWGMLLLDRRSRAIAQEEVTPSWSTPLLLVSDLGFAALGLVIAALWVIFGPVAAAIVLVPLYVARWAMAQFAEQQRAHAATLRRAVPGGRDQGLLHPRAQRAGIPRRGHDRAPDRHAARSRRGGDASPACCMTSASSAFRPRCSRRTAR